MLSEHIHRYALDARFAVPGVAALVLLIGTIWYILSSPLFGVVSGTVVAADGSVRAVRISLSDNQLSGYPFFADQSASAIAAIPSPTSDKAVFITRGKNAPRTLSIANLDGSNAVTIAAGNVDTPSWSPDGASIAYAIREGETTEPVDTPEEWTVYRAVRSGDTLVVGHGYRPFPSPFQRTYALTSEGIALLSYNDSAPSLVVASPKHVPVTTPFTVSEDGMQVAWVAPADQSLQVFENVNGYLVPSLLSTKISPQSLAFSPNGKFLLGTTHTEATTTVHLINVASGRVSEVGQYPGFLKLNVWRYEK